LRRGAGDLQFVRGQRVGLAALGSASAQGRCNSGRAQFGCVVIGSGLGVALSKVCTPAASWSRAPPTRRSRRNHWP